MDELFYWTHGREVNLEISSGSEKESHEYTLHGNEITKFLVDILSEVDAEIRERVLTHLEKQDRKSSKKEPKNAK